MLNVIEDERAYVDLFVLRMMDTQNKLYCNKKSDV